MVPAGASVFLGTTTLLVEVTGVSVNELDFRLAFSPYDYQDPCLTTTDTHADFQLNPSFTAGPFDGELPEYLFEGDIE